MKFAKSVEEKTSIDVVEISSSGFLDKTKTTPDIAALERVAAARKKWQKDKLRHLENEVKSKKSNMFQIEETNEFEEVEVQPELDPMKEIIRKNLIGQTRRVVDHKFESYSNLDLIKSNTKFNSEIDQNPDLFKKLNTNLDE